MSRTVRKDFLGHKQRDGTYLKKCPSANCNQCGTGFYKRILRRITRRKVVRDDG